VGGTSWPRRLIEHQTIRTRNPQTYYNLNTQYTEQRMNLKAAKEKILVTYKGKPIRITANFSKQILNVKTHGKAYFRL
jgi:hypothetical protein